MKAPKQAKLDLASPRRCPSQFMRALTDGSPMPIGKHKGKKMMEVPLAYWRWFMQQEWREKHGNVLAYALTVLGPERAQAEQFKAATGKGAVKRRPEAVVSDPVKAQAALEEMRRMKETLL